MHRVVAHAIHGAAILLTLCAAGCRTNRSAPRDASFRGPATTAADWAAIRTTDLVMPPEPFSAPKDTWVLHIGDSFVDASFQQNLRPHFRKAGTAYVSTGVTATYTTTWAGDPELDRWLAKRPSMVVVTLGANEVDMPVPEEHARAITAIVRKIVAAGASCVWTAPPLWKRDTGIVQVIHDHCAPCLFFDSDAVMGELSAGERKTDRIHPNARGGARWTEAFWEWLLAHRDASRGPWALAPFERRPP